MQRFCRRACSRAVAGLACALMLELAAASPAAGDAERLLAGEPVAGGVDVSLPAAEDRAGVRERMVREQIGHRGIEDGAVLEALRRVPRHRFVPQGREDAAYADRPLAIGHGQTISQPYIVAYMTELLAPGPDDRVLEVGTGSGYQAAVLAEIVREVVSIEIVRALAESAAERLQGLGYRNVTVLHGDGYFGHPPGALYDAIIVTAAAAHVPPPLIEQLRPGGRMAIPVGPPGAVQNLLLVEKDADGEVSSRSLMPVRFVPLTGER